MFSLSGTIKSNGQNFLSNMCTKHTSQAHSVMSGVQAKDIFDALWCNLHLYLNLFCVNIIIFYFLVLNIFCGVNFFLGPAVPWSCGFCRLAPEEHFQNRLKKSSVVEVKQVRCIKVRLCNGQQSSYHRSVVRCNAWMQLCIYTVLLSSTVSCVYSP